MGVACSTNLGKKNAYMILGGKPEEKRRQGRPSCRWVDISEMDLRELAWGGTELD
jgi:hypothetical protein